MNEKKFSKSVFVLIAIVSLSAGGIIYVLFKENSFISILAREWFPWIFQKEAAMNPHFCWIYYVPDFLWALSLSCCLHIIFIPGMKGSLLCTVAVLLLGLSFEILQYFSIVNGTGDIVDVMLYLLAGLTVNLINYKRRR